MTNLIFTLYNCDHILMNQISVSRRPSQPQRRLEKQIDVHTKCFDDGHVSVGASAFEFYHAQAHACNRVNRGDSEALLQSSV